MKVKIVIIPGREVKTVEFSGKDTISVQELLTFLGEEYGVPSSGFVAVKNGVVLTEDDEISDGDVIEVYRVASGG